MKNVRKFGVRGLVIGDTHAKPDESHDEFDRFHAIGSLILDQRPDFVVQIGDLVDMTSLDGWKGARSVGGGGSGRSHERKRLWKDLEAFRCAQRAIKNPTEKANERHRRTGHHERQCQPRWIQLLGNHEERLDRVSEHIPELHELVGTHQLNEISDDNGWECARFGDVIDIAGIDFSHYFSTGVSRRPAPVGQILNKRHRSSVFGHTHSFGHDQQPIPGHGWISALCVGCCKPPHRTGEHEWSGVVIFEDCREGTFSMRQIPYNHLLEQYGEHGYAKQLRAERAQQVQDKKDADGAYGRSAA